VNRERAHVLERFEFTAPGQHVPEGLAALASAADIDIPERDDAVALWDW